MNSAEYMPEICEVSISTPVKPVRGELGQRLAEKLAADGLRAGDGPRGPDRPA